MDGQRFDDVTRLIGSGASRRSVLKGLTGALVGVAGLGLRHRQTGATAVCSPAGEGCGGLDDLPCCVGFFCSPGTETCIACLADGDDSCGSDEQCCSGICAKGVCVADEEPTCAGLDVPCSDELPCCDETLTCGQTPLGMLCFTPTCAAEGEGCGILQGENEVECCSGFVCNSEGTCEPEAPAAECEDDGDCDDGEICCAEACRAIECCIDDVLSGGNPNDRCDDGAVCFEGQCVFACKGDADCEEGTCCCGDGTCYAECCADTDYTPPTGGVTTLPSTGVADGDGNLTGLLGAGLAAGAAAYLAGKKLQGSDQA